MEIHNRAPEAARFRRTPLGYTGAQPRPDPPTRRPIAQFLFGMSPFSPPIPRVHRRTWQWLVPILCVLLFLATVIWLPRQAQQMESAERQEQQIADTLWVEQTIRFQLGRNEDDIRSLVNAIASNGLAGEKLQDRMHFLQRTHPEIKRIVWIAADGRGTASDRKDVLSPDELPEPLRAKLDRVRATSTPEYTQPNPPEGASHPAVMDYILPVLQGGHYVGGVITTYSLSGILEQMVPWWFAQKNEIRLTDRHEITLGQRAAGGAGHGVYTYAHDLNLPYADITLRTDSVRSAPNLLSNRLVTIIVALTLGLFWSLAALWRDINRRTAVEKALREQIAFRTAMEDSLQANARTVTMGEIASTLAHELNQPLAAITSYTTGALNLLNDPAARPDDAGLDRIRGALEKANAQAQRAGHVIRSVHSLAKRREPHRETVDLPALVAGVVQVAELRASQHFITIKTDFGPDTQTVLADPMMLEQVLLNLTRNAIEAMRDVAPERRILRVGASADPLAPGSVIISVADQGCGISPQAREHLFSPFFSTKSDGMGMGLKICRTVVEFHGGTLTYEDNPGGGTIFRFSLPASAAAENMKK